jgi:hypothetical protein
MHGCNRSIWDTVPGAVPIGGVTATPPVNPCRLDGTLDASTLAMFAGVAREAAGPHLYMWAKR